MAEMRAAQQTGQGYNQRLLKPLTGPMQATSLGSRIKLIRKRLGLSQQELAGQDYVASYISAIERDKIHPSLKALELIARRLDEPVEYFLYGGYGSGALVGEGNPPGESSRLAAETSFSLTVRDKLLEVQILIESGTYRGVRAGQPLFEQAGKLLEELPRHQLTEYDRVQVALLAARLGLITGNTQEIIPQIEENRLLAQRTQQPDQEIELNMLLGQVYSDRQQPEQALDCYQTARNLVDTYKDQLVPELQLQVLTGLASNFLSGGQEGPAFEVFEEALRLKEYYAKPQARAELYSKLAGFYSNKGDLYQARKFRRLALSIYEQLNVYCHLLRLSAGVGEGLTNSGKLEEAETVLSRTMVAGQGNLGLLGSDLALAYNALAGLRLRQNNLPEARRISRLGIEEARKAGDRLAEGKALRLAAEIESGLNQPEAARQLYEQAIATLEDAAASYTLGDVYKAYGEALSRWGDFETAVIYLKKAYDSKS
jgi:tetratricopeptide (TPR) repeat protein